MGPTDRRSDEELVEVCNVGDAHEAARAFEALYRRHRDFVLRVARRFTRDRELALDALQETFAYLLNKFPPAGAGLTLTARLPTLLYPAAKNAAITAVRKARRAAGAGDAELDELPAEVVPDEEPIDAALVALSPERREVLTLRFVDDLSLAEIAVALDVPLGTVKSRLHLALKELREDSRIKDLFDP
ncbi:MAG TPA: sigma-70 family RNA polymerase sigma factor [Gammaproteobacteria bacterium]